MQIVCHDKKADIIIIILVHTDKMYVFHDTSDMTCVLFLTSAQYKCESPVKPEPGYTGDLLKYTFIITRTLRICCVRQPLS